MIQVKNDATSARSNAQDALNFASEDRYLSNDLPFLFNILTTSSFLHNMLNNSSEIV